MYILLVVKGVVLWAKSDVLSGFRNLVRIKETPHRYESCCWNDAACQNFPAIIKNFDILLL